MSSCPAGVGKLPRIGCVLLLICPLIFAQSVGSSLSGIHRPGQKRSSKKSNLTRSSSTPAHEKLLNTRNTSKARRNRGRHKIRSAHTGKHGQQRIDHDRVREIQQALIREHYLQGQPSAVWDTATQKALEKYQADNDWQAKTVPDSRALIKLGLGPNHAHLLNPETAMTGLGPASNQESQAAVPTTHAAPADIAPANPAPSKQPQQ